MNQGGRRLRRVDYHKKSYQNPFFRSRPKPKKEFKIILPKISFKFIFYLFLGLAFFAGLFWFAFLSSFFMLKNVEIEIPQKFNSEEVRGLVWQQAVANRWRLKQNNLFIFDKEGLVAEFNKRYVISNLLVRKIFPNTIKITFQEKIYQAVWREGEKYYLYNFEDNSASEIDPLQLKDKNFPLIENQGDSQFFDGKINNQSDKVTFIVDFYAKISKNFKYNIERFLVEAGEGNTIVMQIQAGPQILINPKENLDKQILKLYNIINEKLKDDFMKKSSIDVRFGDAVYIK